MKHAVGIDTRKGRVRQKRGAMRQAVLIVVLVAGAFLAGDQVGYSRAHNTTDMEVQAEREQWRRQFKADHDAMEKCEIEKQILSGAAGWTKP